MRCAHVYDQSHHCIHCGEEQPIGPPVYGESTLTCSYATFTKEDVGKYLYIHKRYGWWARLKDWFRTKVFRKESNLIQRYMITDVYGCESVHVQPTFFCPSCKQVRPWEHGCADDMPEICDTCWAARQEGG